MAAGDPFCSSLLDTVKSYIGNGVFTIVFEESEHFDLENNIMMKYVGKGINKRCYIFFNTETRKYETPDKAMQTVHLKEIINSYLIKMDLFLGGRPHCMINYINTIDHKDGEWKDLPHGMARVTDIRKKNAE